MPTITDWMMVIITFLYVIATVFICHYNSKSAKATQAQLDEMRKQFEEENRPYITVEFIYEKRAFYGVRFSNHGKRIASNVSISFDQPFIDSIHETNFRNILDGGVGKTCVIGISQHHTLYFGTNKYRKQSDKPPLSGTVTYMCGATTYQEPFYIDVENYATICSLNSETEDILRTMKEQNVELARICNILTQQKSNEMQEIPEEAIPNSQTAV